MSRWFRVYDDVINDPKLLKLPEALRWQWLAMLCVASKNGGKLPANDDIALMLRVPEAKAAEFVTKLVKAKLIDKVGDLFVPHNWEGRQFKSDTSNDRVKKHREGKRNVTLKQDCNVTDAVTSDVTETGPEAEAKTESETEQSKAEARELDEMGLKHEGMLKAAFTAECSGRAVFPDMSIIKTWLLAGIAVATVSNTVTPILRRKQDMKSLVYCDSAVREAHARAPARVEPEIDRSNWFIVVEGTLEHTCHNIIRKERGELPLFLCRQIGKDGTIYERAAKCPTLFPVEFNDVGERISPSAEDAA